LDHRVLAPTKRMFPSDEGSPPSSHGTNPPDFVQLYGALKRSTARKGPGDRRLVAVLELPTYR